MTPLGGITSNPKRILTRCNFNVRTVKGYHPQDVEEDKT